MFSPLAEFHWKLLATEPAFHQGSYSKAVSVVLKTFRVTVLFANADVVGWAELWTNRHKSILSVGVSGQTYSVGPQEVEQEDLALNYRMNPVPEASLGYPELT